MNERVYWTAEVSEMVGIGTSTIRKYSLALEAKGYIIQRNEKQQRAFTSRDVTTLKRLKELTQVGGMTLDNAIKTFIAESENEDVTEAHDVEERDTGRSGEMAAILEYMKRQDERIDKLERFNRELVDKLDQQTKYLADKIDRRDEQMTGAIRELQESKRLIAASQEKEEPKKGFLARFLGK